ncbi:MAG TPA: hypothetical protein VFN89_07100 [Solirubrobacterales bacterium]|nr:hypothetical protein [Solirubrobacterales bacterium]
MPGTIDTLSGKACAALAILAGAAVAFVLCWAAASASAAPLATRSVYAAGKIVPIPASIPHEAGDMIDRRIVPDLRWIAARYPIYVTDGYSGPLPDGEHVGCNMCHVRNSDHYNGLAVDLVPLNGTPGRCDASWAPITRLAHWAEPVQNEPRAPFRWVGYEGDAGHGCGNHLHLSWEHSVAPMFQLAEWVEVFPVHGQTTSPTPPTSPPTPSGPRSGVKPPKGPRGGSEAESTPTPQTGPSGGMSTAQFGGVSPHGD